ncbi:hypothetical protein B0J11DRAFT_423614 [Dendryphion nanum]|uniref:TOM core complex subunit Tom6 n=1 Tax=Dendryphion nanum TaxID=256645 RepID=A0A9P9EM27_9PLEO|nr:hypothetical protein B0J11DRAFT_423614 [Dendryphion nanum]
MPPKAVRSRPSASEPSFGQTLVQSFKSAENRQLVTAVGLFAIGVTFLHSSWSELLLPL